MTLKNGIRVGVSKILQYGPAILIFFLSIVGEAQDLAPRAYLITPVHSNAITLTYSYFSGNLLFDGAVPITDSTAKVNVCIISYTHSLRIFGRSANFTASLPYGVGNFRGRVLGAEPNAYRSGTFDSSYRLSVNLKVDRQWVFRNSANGVKRCSWASVSDSLLLPVNMIPRR